MRQRPSLRCQDFEGRFPALGGSRRKTTEACHNRQQEYGSRHEEKTPSISKCAMRLAPISGPTTEPTPLTRMSRPLTATTRSAGIESCARATQTGYSVDMKPPSKTAAGRIVASGCGRNTMTRAVTAKPRLSEASTMRRSKRSESRPTGIWKAKPPSTATSINTAMVACVVPCPCIQAGTSA
jgi:hypothetical protein